jgi:hypothetical protein
MLLLSIIAFSEVRAEPRALDPLNRITAGMSWSDGSPGISFGLDSRLTQIVYVNIGAFSSLGDREYAPTEDEDSWLSLRSGIWAAPGFRWPHRYNAEGMNWDLIVRGGFGCVISEDAFGEDWWLVDPATLAGADYLIRFDEYGIRATGKYFFYQPYLPEAKQKVPVSRPQLSIEAFYQW